MPLLLLIAPAFAQAASYAASKDGCNGEGLPTRCLAVNDQQPQFVYYAQPQEYAFGVVNTSGNAIQLLGFDMFTASATNSTETGTSTFYLDANGPTTTILSQPVASPSATGFLSVGGFQTWWSTSLFPPPVIQPGQAFWVGFNASSRISPPLSTNAFTPAPAKCRQPNINNNAWLNIASSGQPALRVRCTTPGYPVHTLTAATLPRPGQTLDLQASGGLAYAPGFLFWGYNTFSWNGLLLPFEMTPLGAPGCYVYTSSDVSQLFLTDATGAATISTAVPNAPRLLGVAFVNQSLVASQAPNMLGFIASNLGRGVIGN